jgi:hypothetical protein
MATPLSFFAPLVSSRTREARVCEPSATRSLLLGASSEWRSSAACARRSAAYSVAPSTGAIALAFTPPPRGVHYLVPYPEDVGLDDVVPGEEDEGPRLPFAEAVDA